MYVKEGNFQCVNMMCVEARASPRIKLAGIFFSSFCCCSSKSFSFHPYKTVSTRYSRGRLSHMRYKFLTDMRKKMSKPQYIGAEPH
jgi:hypothetical protein